jgi:hypothetical protein
MYTHETAFQTNHPDPETNGKNNDSLTHDFKGARHNACFAG